MCLIKYHWQRFIIIVSLSVTAAVINTFFTEMLHVAKAQNYKLGGQVFVNTPFALDGFQVKTVAQSGTTYWVTPGAGWYIFHNGSLPDGTYTIHHNSPCPSNTPMTINIPAPNNRGPDIHLNCETYAMGGYIKIDGEYATRSLMMTVRSLHGSIEQRVYSNENGFYLITNLLIAGSYTLDVQVAGCKSSGPITVNIPESHPRGPDFDIVCAKNPVIFVTGMMGSQIRMYEGQEIKPDSDKWLWPIYPDTPKKLMSLKDGGYSGIYTDDVVREYKAFNVPFINYKIYSPFIEKLVSDGYQEYQTSGYPANRTNCDLNQKDKTLFIFPWDFRKGASPENVELLAKFINCAQQLNSGKNVDVIAHSMGGYLVQKYILSHTSEHRIRKFVSIGTPWLGSPQAISALLTGQLDKTTNDLISPEYIKGLTEHFIGAHELLPAAPYFAHTQVPPIVISRIAANGVDRLPDVPVSYSTFGPTLKEFYTSPWEPVGYVTNENMIGHNIALFSDDGFYNWSNNYGIDYHIIYGDHWKQTVGQVRIIEQKVCDYSVSNTCKKVFQYQFKKVRGDGTVPLLSTKKLGTGFNYNHSAQLHFFSDNPYSPPNALAGHLELTHNTSVQDCVLSILKQQVCNDLILASSSNEDEIGGNQLLKYIHLWGINSLYISDDKITTQNLITSTLGLNNIPGIAVDYTGDNSVLITFLATPNYKFTFESEGVIFVNVDYGTNNLDPLQTITYTNVEVIAGTKVQLTSSTPLSVTLTKDTNGDGNAETLIPPTTVSEVFSIFLPVITQR